MFGLTVLRIPIIVVYRALYTSRVGLSIEFPCASGYLGLLGWLGVSTYTVVRAGNVQNCHLLSIYGRVHFGSVRLFVLFGRGQAAGVVFRHPCVLHMLHLSLSVAVHPFILYPYRNLKQGPIDRRCLYLPSVISFAIVCCCRKRPISYCNLVLLRLSAVL